MWVYVALLGKLDLKQISRHPKGDLVLTCLNSLIRNCLSNYIALGSWIPHRFPHLDVFCITDMVAIHHDEIRRTSVLYKVCHVRVLYSREG